MAPRLKVFRAHMGFFDSIVAAPSQKAALEAWGTRQDLFGEGLAETTADADAVKAATARPGVVLRRAAGSSDPFQEEARPPAAPPAPPRAKATGKAKDQAPEPEPEPPPPPDRSALTAAERALQAAEAEHRRAAEALDVERRRLEAQARELEDGFRAQARELQKAVDKARRAYERAGGR